jgi:hypothetical protein
MVTVGKFEVMSDNFLIMDICIGGNYARRQISELHDSLLRMVVEVKVVTVPKHIAIKAHSKSAVDEPERSGSRFGLFTPVESTSGVHCIGSA